MFHIDLERNSQLSLSRQIYNFMKESILIGKLEPKEKLPSTRSMADDLKVSRNVVVECYEQLIAEGYIYTLKGSGTYISEGIFFERKTLIPFNQEDNKSDLLYQVTNNVISFRPGVPDLGSIPIKDWGRLYRDITLSVNPNQLDYQSTQGMYKLRFQLALYLFRVRGVVTSPDNIIITNGAAQAFSLLCHMLSKEDYVVVENPLSHGIVHTLKSHEVRVETIPVDQEGIVTELLPKKPPKLIFTTPSHQFPTGVIMPIKRRIELIEYARKQGSYIVEDDYDSEFRFEGNPIQSLQNLDPDCVVYVGTFSKTLSPALRLGYMVLPRQLIDEIREAKYVADLHSPILEQLTMADFIEKGHLDRHIKKVKSIYLKRRNHLIKCLDDKFHDEVMISGSTSGMHLVATFNNIQFCEELLKKMENHLVYVPSMREHYIVGDESIQKTDRKYENAFVFGYGNVDTEAITIGIERFFLASSCTHQYANYSKEIK